MLTIYKKYREDYTGEDIVTERKHEGRVWHDIIETIPNAVTNNQISNRAVAIGNGTSRLKFDLKLLKKPAGLLGSKTLQTYGCNALYRDFNPDFLIATGNNGIVKEIADSGYTADNIVYTNAIHLLEHPNKFYLIPYDPYADAGTTAAYIAAFDGHKQIYLVGFDGQINKGINDNVYADTSGYDGLKVDDLRDDKWATNLKQLFDIYNDVDFVKVSLTGRAPTPEIFKYCSNFRHISFRELVLEADL